MEENQNSMDNKQETESVQLLNLRAEIDDLQKQLSEETNRHLRTRADFENYRKRIEREDEARRLSVKKEILTDLISFLDYFDQARKQLQDESAAKGLEIIARQFSELLQKHGVRPIKCLGLPYDPEAQEGVGFLVTDQCEEGCVAEEICCGYMLNDILLKPARVLVARRKEEND